MNFAAIIPDRGDRKQFFDHCLDQVSRFTLKPTKVYAITYPPDNDEMDLVKRLRVGVQMASDDGIDLVFVIESDDAYPKDYFERFAPFFKDYEFFGDETTTYYNLRNKTHRTWTHSHRSSLFTTGFKISALNLFDWPTDNEKFLDITLWNYARRRKKIFVNAGAVGIKHGIGKVGGKGHIMRMTHLDKDLKYLKANTNGSFEFYEQLMKTL